MTAVGIDVAAESKGLDLVALDGSREVVALGDPEERTVLLPVGLSR